VIAKRVIPTYELLDEEELQKLEAHADWILKEIGIEFRGDEEALALFRVASATVDGERVRFDSGHAHALCATAPRQFQMLGRDPARTITLGRRSSCVDAQLWAALCQRSKQGPSICNA
jgi:trimethylamine--corrinoid protein Co-methyltransferase